MTKPIILDGDKVYLVVGSTIKRCETYDGGEQHWVTVRDPKEHAAVRAVLWERLQASIKEVAEAEAAWAVHLATDGRV